MDLQFNTLLGKTISAIEVRDDEIIFACNDGSVYRQYHSQSCCENVEVEDICGDLNDLIDRPVTLAEEVTYTDKWPEDMDDPEHFPDSFTWTFYKLGTNKGSVTIRWYGTSNGYYSESVSFTQDK